MSVLPRAMNEGESVFSSEQVEKLWDLSKGRSINLDTLPTYATIWDVSQKIVNTVEKYNQKIMVFDVQGIPKEFIFIDTDFVNKTKDMYININGECHDRYLEIDKEIHEKIYVDTDIYENYDYKIDNGLLILTLFEKINMPPEFNRVEGQC